MASFTDRELDVMAVLWERGPSTVAEVREHLEDRLAYTTVLTVLRTLEAKGFVSHEEEGDAQACQHGKPDHEWVWSIRHRTTPGQDQANPFVLNGLICRARCLRIRAALANARRFDCRSRARVHASRIAAGTTWLSVLETGRAVSP